MESGDNPITLSLATDTVGGCNGGNTNWGSFKVANPYVSDEDSGPLQYVTIEKSGGGLANSMARDSAASLDVTVGPDTAPSRRSPERSADQAPDSSTCLLSHRRSTASTARVAGTTACSEAALDTRSTINSSTPRCAGPSRCRTGRDTSPTASSRRTGTSNKAQSITYGRTARKLRTIGTASPCRSTRTPRWVTLFIMDELAFQTAR